MKLAKQAYDSGKSVSVDIQDKKILVGTYEYVSKRGCFINNVIVPNIINSKFTNSILSNVIFCSRSFPKQE
jgi:hypothetical protein